MKDNLKLDMEDLKRQAEEALQADELHLEKLRTLKNTLLELPSDSLNDSLFILIDYMLEAGHGNISDSSDGIGIDVTNKGILIYDVEHEKELAFLGLNLG